jgi:hypothetical protein
MTIAPDSSLPATGSPQVGVQAAPNAPGVTPNAGFADANVPTVGVGGSIPAGADATSIVQDVSQKLGAGWAKLGGLGQAEIIKAALAVPGGLQAQKNKAAELAIAQQRVNQTSYGSSVPTTGLINRVKA